MEFFIFLIAALQAFVIPARVSGSGQWLSMTGLNLMPVYGAYIIAASLYAIVYLLTGIGLYVMAKKAGYSTIWRLVGFVPFVNLFLIGKLCGNSKLRGGISVQIVVIVTFILQLLYTTTLLLNTIAWTSAIAKGSLAIQGNNFIIKDYNLENMIRITNIISWVLSFVASFAAVALYALFFRLYSPNNALLIVLLNIFIPITWVFIFSCRNVKPMSAEEYYKRMQVNIYTNMQNSNGYTSTNHTPPQPPADPFHEFDDKKTNSTNNTDPFGYDDTPKSIDPFDDFNTKNKG